MPRTRSTQKLPSVEVVLREIPRMSATMTAMPDAAQTKFCTASAAPIPTAADVKLCQASAAIWER
jgi:hypothetical protein